MSRLSGKRFLLLVIFTLLLFVHFRPYFLLRGLEQRGQQVHATEFISILPDSHLFPPNCGLRYISVPHRAIEVLCPGQQLLDRVKAFNGALDVVRDNITRSRHGIANRAAAEVECTAADVNRADTEAAWRFELLASNDGNQHVTASAQQKRPNMAIVKGSDDDFLQQLSKYGQVTTLILPWDETLTNDTESGRLVESTNLVVNDYFPWSATDPLCSWIEGKTGFHTYDIIYKTGCNRNISLSVVERPISIPRVMLNIVSANRVRYFWTAATMGDGPAVRKTTEDDFFHKSPPILSYCHIFNDAIVNTLGHVFTYDMKFVPYGCSTDDNAQLPEDAYGSAPLYDELLVITQYWGTATFHRMVEIVPRIVLFLEFLQRHPNVKILAPEGDGGRLGELLWTLGFDPRGRLVTGNTRAKIVYLPQPSMCGTASIPEFQILSMLYQRFVVQHLLLNKSNNIDLQGHPHNKQDTKISSPQRNRLVLIKRSGLRRFSQHPAIESIVSRAAVDFGLDYQLFNDNPVPSLNDTMRLFHSAVMVVGPHGAGLANIVFSQPGTYVIEGVCNVPHINMCFHRTAVILGHHWHGVPSKQGCEEVVEVEVSEIDAVVRQYLTYWKKRQDSVVKI